MVRIILGVIVGFIVWSIIWVGSDQVMIASIGWYGDHQHGFEKAMFNKAPFEPLTIVLIMNIVRGLIVTLIAGYMTAIVAKENKRSPLILGIVLLLCGAAVEVMAWSYLPVWYHFLFLLMLIPLAMAGGKLKKFG